MKELIAKDAFGIFADKHDIARANSLIVAEFFGKRHDRVLRAIANITDPKNGVSEAAGSKRKARAVPGDMRRL